MVNRTEPQNVNQNQIFEPNFNFVSNMCCKTIKRTKQQLFNKGTILHELFNKIMIFDVHIVAIVETRECRAERTAAAACDYINTHPAPLNSLRHNIFSSLFLLTVCCLFEELVTQNIPIAFTMFCLVKTLTKSSYPYDF